MWSYLIEVQLCWLLLIGFFWVSLRSETYFYANRWYLMTTLILGLIIPFVKLSQNGLTSITEGVVFQLPSILVGINNNEAGAGSFFNTQLLWQLYWIGAIVALARVFIGLFIIFKWIEEGHRSHFRGYILVQVRKKITPFSFFNYLFISSIEDFSEHDIETVAAHEMTHIRNWHSADRMILEVLGVFFWFSPLIYLFKNLIKDVHEYEADAYAVKTTDLVKYGELLLRYNLQSAGTSPTLSSPFVRNQLQKRFIMLTRKPSNQISLVKYLLVVPLLLLSLFVLSCKDQIDVGFSDSNQSPDSELTGNNQQNVGNQEKVVSFEGDLLDAPNEKALDNKLPVFGSNPVDLQHYIVNHIIYPDEAKSRKVEGIVVVQFMIDQDGNVRNAKVIKSVGYGCDEEALRVINGMPKWTPGLSKGKKVASELSIPISFKLS